MGTFSLELRSRKSHSLRGPLILVLTHRQAWSGRVDSLISDRDRLRALRYFATMVIYTGHPDYLNEHRAAEYNFEVSRNFAQNLLLARRVRAEEKLRHDGGKMFPVRRKRWHRASETWVVYTFGIDDCARSAKFESPP